MGMRETPKSLRAWFGIVGAVTVMRALGLAAARDEDATRFVAVVLGLVFGVAYVYFAARLPPLLFESPQKIVYTLWASSVVVGLTAISEVLTSSVGGFVGSIIQLLINWYLLRNTKRLAVEAKAAQAYRLALKDKAGRAWRP